MNIYLIGLPGSGKSTLGKLLSILTEYEYLDMDEEICSREGETIETIFSEKGENYFRELEHEILQETFERTNHIISTGGGVPCFFDNMAQMKKHGLTVYINPSIDELAKRLQGQGRENRPMLKGKNTKQVKEFLELRQKERAPYYEQAQLIFSSDKVNAEDLYAKIKPLL